MGAGDDMDGCLKFGAMAVMVVALFAFAAWGFSVCWNALVVPKFGAPEFGFQDSAFAIALLAFVRGGGWTTSTNKKGGAR